jgi:O-antigen/teichoic acid export membrane protein
MPVQEELLDALSTTHLNTDLRGRSVRGVSLTLTSQAARFVLQLASTVVLARMLTPADFGLVAMATAITGLASAFQDLGLSEATIQRQQISDNQVSTLFWINTAVGLGLMLVTAALAPLLAWFYHEPRLKDVTLLLSVSFLFSGLTVQHGALLKRQMRFVALGIRDVASLALALPVGIILAWRGAGYWAIVAVPLTSNFTLMALSWAMFRWMPSLPRRNAQVGSMVVFGGNIATSYLLLNLMRSADSILIGRYLGAVPLGLYSRAFNLVMQPARQLFDPVGNVAIPTFSRLQDDPERFARYYLRTINLMVWVSASIFGFLFVAAEPVTLLVLGNKWRAAAPVFQILAILAFAQLPYGSTIWLFVSRGQSRKLLNFAFISSLILIASYWIGLPFGIKGVALSGSLVQLAILPWVLKYTFDGTRLTLPRFGLAILYPASVGLAGVAFAELVLHLVTPQHTVSELLVVAIAFGAIYLLSALIPAVREEVLSLRNLLNELRLRRVTVKEI